MRTVRLSIAAMVAMLAASLPAAAADEHTPAWRDGARDALEKLDDALRAFEHFLETMPEFEIPFLDENGNIVIPRRPAPPPVAEPDPSETVAI